jgi:ribosomal protein S21
VAETHARPDEDIERVLRRFNRQVKEEDILRRVRDLSEYEKPSEVRKRLKRERVRKNRKRMQMEEW